MSGRILVAARDAATLETIGFALFDEGYHVVLAWTGEIAQHRITTFNPNLIILDMLFQIGERMALEVCRKELCPEAPIIALVGSESLHSLAKELGANEWMMKPVDTDELLRQVEKYTGASAA